MKILMVAIPNHHFFQWVNQMKDTGHEVFWFDITAGAGFSNKIDWVQQNSNWKLKWDFPFRSKIKNSFPKIYKFIQKINERNTAIVFQNYLNKIQPDVVHSFELIWSCLPILKVMQKSQIPWMYSSWGSDVFYHKELGVSTAKVLECLKRIDFLITDCKRDYQLLQNIGFKNKFLGVFPGNGGININISHIQPIEVRKNILIKGYESFGCKASTIIKALELLPVALFADYEVIIYSCDLEIESWIKKSLFFNSINFKIYLRSHFISNNDMLELMGQSILHISNNISDGMPNTLLESMGMGAFPIQSNPGGATEEVLFHAKNGFLISDSLDAVALSKLIFDAVNNENLRRTAQDYNTNFILKNYNRKELKSLIGGLYEHAVLEQ